MRSSCAATTSASSRHPSTRAWAAPDGPGAGVAGDLLGLSDDVRFRKAERLYVRGHLPATTFAQEKARLAARGGAAELLEQTMNGDTEPWRRARAANLLGILLVEDAKEGRELAPTLSRQAVRAFSTGARQAEGADEPRFNLEILLTQLRPNGLIGRDLSQDSDGPGQRLRRRARDPGEGLLNVHLVTPWAAAVAVVVVVPVAAFVVSRRRAAVVRRAVDLDPPPAAAPTWTLAVLVLSIGLLALAAAQPVVASHEASKVPRDADVFIVIDTSRSMLATSDAGAPTRFERARAIAKRLRDATPTAAVGIASLTDRVLPHLFPTEDRADFDVTLSDAIAVQRPPPAENIGGSGTSLAALGDLATAGFFAPEARTRIAVVLTDGESQPFPVDRVAAALKRARIRPVLIRLGNPSERVYTPAGRAETYRPAGERASSSPGRRCCSAPPRMRSRRPGPRSPRSRTRSLPARASAAEHELGA